MSRIPRVHCPELPVEGERATLDANSSRHLIRVLRLEPGSALRVFDGRGREHDARLVSSGGSGAEIEVLALRESAPESGLGIRLLQGVGRGERMDLVVQKATELGVSSIVPVLSARSVVRLAGERAARRRAHWQAVAVNACEQCGRATLPEILPPSGLDAALASVADDATRLVADPDAGVGLAGLTRPAAGLTLLIGPEGGLDDGELARAATAGFRSFRLGPRVLRTETAAIAALALIQGLWGDLGR